MDALEPHTVTSSEIAAALSDADGLAVDALFGDAASLPTAERSAQLAAALSLLEPASLDAEDGSRRALLVDATMARVLRASRDATVEVGVGVGLHQDDGAALDALVESGWRGDVVAGPVGERARRLERALAPLGAAPMGVGMTGELLVNATLARVEAEIRRRDSLMMVSSSDLDARGGRGRFSLSDLVTVAAMLVFSLGVLWPVAASWREGARQQECASNLATSGSAFEMFARDHNGRMPVATAGFGGGNWWTVGDPKHSHSANLFTLAKSGYASLEELSCTGNSMALLRGPAHAMDDWRSIDEISFSYQLPARRVMMWNGPARFVVLTDKSPVIERAYRGERFDPEARSLNHRGRGQNVLMSDGSVFFLDRPVLENGDNIWLPGSITDPFSATLNGTELPSGETDAFVAP